MHKESNIKIMLKMAGLVKPLMFYMIIAITLGVLGFLCAIFIPYLCTVLITSIATNTDTSIQILFSIIIVIAILRGILHYGEQACNHYIAFKLLALLRDKVFKVLRTLAPAKLEGKDRGNLVYMVTGDIEALEVFYAHTISPILIAIITSCILLVLFYSMHPIFALIALLAYLFTGLFIPMIITKLGRKEGEETKEAFGEMSSYTLESLRGMQDILQYQEGQERLEGMQKRSDELNTKQKKLKQHEGTSSSLGSFSVVFFSLLIFLYGCFLFINKEMDFSTILLSTVLMVSSFGPVLALSALSNHLLMTMASARRVLSLLDEKPQVEEITGKSDIAFGEINVDNVHFAYDQEWILKNINYNFKPGKTIGILGKSGSGKSTLLKLLMRFFSPNQGTISLQEKDIDQINTANLRDMQSYVTQETILFHDTIYNNIKIAHLDASLQEVEAACKKANIHDFITSLPKGYETPVSELGESLSGGEKQRIALARAFLHDSPCILLDEPTSNLDILNEAIILKSLKEQKEKTILLVSHRPSTLKIADKILEMENGRVC